MAEKKYKTVAQTGSEALIGEVEEALEKTKEVSREVKKYGERVKELFLL